MVFLLLAAIGSYLGAQDKSDYYEQLSDPVALTRAKAALEYSKLCTIEDLNKLLDGYQTKYWNGSEYEYTDWPADHQAFAEVIEFWPTCIDDSFVDKLYKYKDTDTFPRIELEYIIAYALYQNAMRFDETGAVGLKVRDYWFESWLPEGSKRINQYVWRDLYQAIVSNDWILERVLASEKVNESARRILYAFADKLDKYQELNPEFEDQAYDWYRKLADCLHRGEKPPKDTHKGLTYDSSYRTPMGYMKALDLIAVLCDRRDWLPEIEEILSKKEMTDLKYNIGPMWNVIVTPVAPVNEVIRSENLKEELEKYFQDKDVWPWAEYVDRDALLHHSWFEDLRKSDNFKEWWNEWNHQHEYVEPGPTFGVPNARKPDHSS